MRYLVLILTSLLLSVSCEKNNTQALGKPAIPANDSLDLNADQVIDFVVRYKELATKDEPSSGGSIIGSVYPIKQNQLLYRENVGVLFLDNNDTIRQTSNTNSNWSIHPADLISIDRDYQNWDRTWTILSGQHQFYFLAYKINLGNSEKIGWICLRFDTATGVISITDGDISDSNELIIHKKIID